MEFFLNEWSLHGQYATSELFFGAAVRFIALFERARRAANHRRGLLFRSETIELCCAVGDDDFRKSLNAIKKRELKEMLLEVVFDKTSPAPWEAARRHTRPDEYHWVKPKIDHSLQSDEAEDPQTRPHASGSGEQDVDSLAESNGSSADEHLVNVTDTSVAEVAERLRCGAVKIACLLNFVGSRLTGHLSLEVRKNDEAELTSVPSFEAVDTFDKWLGGFRGAAPYDTNTRTPLDEETCLVDATRFVRTSLPEQQGRAIYEELLSGDLYYVDNLHRGADAHLEVFSKRKVHRGEASLDGVLRPNTADKKKKL